MHQNTVEFTYCRDRRLRRIWKVRMVSLPLHITLTLPNKTSSQLTPIQDVTSLTLSHPPTHSLTQFNSSHFISY